MSNPQPQEVSPALLWGIRRYLAAPQAQIQRIQRRPFVGGLSGSQLAYWHISLRRAGAVSQLMLVFKQGKVVPGAFLRGAPQREALTYAHLTPHIPLRLPTVLALQTTTGALWMLPFPPAKPASHWSAAWDEQDVRAAIHDLAHLHAAFWNQQDLPHTYPWLWQPTDRDAPALLEDARASLARIQQQGWVDDILTPQRLDQLQALAHHPQPLLTALQTGPQTLLHGDAGFQNILIPQEGGRPLWFDWQLTSWGTPALDWVTFLHPWHYPQAHPPLSPASMHHLYLEALARQGISAPTFEDFQHQLDAALLWRWLIQWAPLLGLYRERLRADVQARLYAVFQRLHWPALDRWTASPP